MMPLKESEGQLLAVFSLLNRKTGESLNEK